MYYINIDLRVGTHGKTIRSKRLRMSYVSTPVVCAKIFTRRGDWVIQDP